MTTLGERDVTALLDVSPSWAVASPPCHGKLWRGLSEVPADLGPRVVTLGMFDGVHRGHARLIRRARAFGLPTVLVTFDPHPARVVGRPRDTATLSTVHRRARLAWQHGVDEVCVLPFTREFASLRPDEFIDEVLVRHLHAARVVVGSNFTFGYRGTGTVDTLRELGARGRIGNDGAAGEGGFEVDGVDLLRAEGDIRCSSTYIRSCVRSGDLDAAARALGRPHHIEGLRTTGDELVIDEHTALPPAGRYAGVLSCGQGVDVDVTAAGRVLLRADGGMAFAGPVGVDLMTAHPRR